MRMSKACPAKEAKDEIELLHPNYKMMYNSIHQISSNITKNLSE